jgi:CheY-like chemotaxis protein
MAVILSADDDPDIRQLIERVLSRAGHRVVLAPDGQAALEAAFTQDFDLVILDGEMPRLHGLVACRTLRDDPRTSHVPVIIASGSLVPPYTEVTAAGASGCMTKPFTPAQLREIVDAQLGTVVGHPLAG